MNRMKRALACLLTLAMLTGSTAIPAAAEEETTIAVADASAEELTAVTVNMNLPAAEAEALQGRYQALQKMKSENEAQIEVLMDEINEAAGKLGKGEITEEAYDSIVAENDVQIEALGAEYLSAQESLQADANEIAEAAFTEKQALWGLGSGLRFVAAYPDSGTYCLIGKLTAEQLATVQQDPDVDKAEVYEVPDTQEPEPADLLPYKLSIETDSFSYLSTTQPFEGRYGGDTLTLRNTNADLLVTGIYQNKTDPEALIYTVDYLTPSGSIERCFLEEWRSVPGNETVEVGDLLRIQINEIVDTYPSIIPCGKNTTFQNLGKGWNVLGEEFKDVVQHELLLSPLYGSDAYTLLAASPKDVKNWNYYWNLDDYSVYKEYVETHGKPLLSGDEKYIPDETLPAEQDLPWYGNMRFYVTNDACMYGLHVEFKDGNDLDDTKLEKMTASPSYFGFPDAYNHDEWEETVSDTGAKVVHDRGWHVLHVTGSRSNGSIDLRFDELAKNGVQEIPVIRSVVDLYRIQLTLEHSPFGQTYAEEFCFEELLIAPNGPADAYYIFGDPSGDGVVNASDAANVLISAATLGAGGFLGLTEGQQSASDVNGDGTVNASDAAVILIYAAELGAGNRYANLRDHVKK